MASLRKAKSLKCVLIVMRSQFLLTFWVDHDDPKSSNSSAIGLIDKQTSKEKQTIFQFNISRMFT